jgi:NTP pyrophosphatase (non-canonical NTP hydrolase)
MNIKQLIKEAHENAVRNNFYSSYPKNDVYKKLQEEVQEFGLAIPSETFNKDSEQSEISDIILVLLAYCGEKGYDIEQDIIVEMEYNKTREYRET